MQKVAHYRRAVWLLDDAPNLEQMIRRVLQAQPRPEDTKFEYRQGIQAQVAERSTEGRGVGLYLTLFTEGRRAATVENGGPRVRKRPAPAGEEFLRTGLLIVVEGNNAAYIADGQTNSGQITALLHRFLHDGGVGEAGDQFQLDPVLNEEQVERLIAGGVKSIDLDVASFTSSIRHLNEGGRRKSWMASVKTLGRSIRDSFVDDRDPAKREAAAYIQAKVHLQFDGRRDDPLLPVVMSSLARGVAEEANQFRIVTTDNAIITHDKLVVKAEIQVEGDDVATDPDSAFRELRSVLGRWRRAGVFER